MFKVYAIKLNKMQTAYEYKKSRKNSQNGTLGIV